MKTDAELDALLLADAQAGPADEGFSERLLARLPARRRRMTRRSRLPARAAQLAALTAALAAFGLLWSSLPADAGADARSATGVLLLLVIAWTLPQARLNPWR
jgi:ferric-dicitrate binding protein FerR (iron transport regulator)